MPVAMTPLSRSPANTTAPARAPAVRYTFDAPGLPEPSRVGSRPTRRPTSTAVGIVPRRYPSATTSTSTEQWYAGTRLCRVLPTRGEPAMPTYEYRCKSCGHELEVQQSFTDSALTECPVCHGELRKVFGNIAVTFKGSGFYKTDSRSSSSSSASSSSSESKSDAKSDTKSETKTETKT